ncbi:MAG TPA: hypothetical protein VLT17_07315 [Gemmatimonadales bacterium]|jgi:hypothetical protein|nr:hypothetical protein [Gemmatimonadales bacterium]
MIHEAFTSVAPAEVLQRAKQFFAERVPNTSAYPEREGPSFLTLRGQGGEEIAISVAAGAGYTRIRASTLFFDQALDRFFSTLPAANKGAA